MIGPSSTCKKQFLDLRKWSKLQPMLLVQGLLVSMTFRPRSSSPAAKLYACCVQDFMPRIAHIFKGTATKLAPGREARTCKQKSTTRLPSFSNCERRFHTISWTVT